MPDAVPERKLPAKRRGNRLGFWFFRMALRLFGLRGAYGLLYFVCSYYLLFDWVGDRAALAYLRRRFRSHGRLRLIADTYRLFLSQGRHLIDRYCLLTGYGRWDMRIEGLERIQPLLDSGKGFVLVTAHVGNWQAVMGCLQGFKRRVHLLMRPEDNPSVQENLKVTAGNAGVNVISPEGFLGGVVEMATVLQQGDIVAIMGDRSYDFNAVPATFLGEPAQFPYGAFHIAAVTGSPVVVLLSAKESLWRYTVLVAEVFHPRYERGKDKRAQLAAWVQQFAGVLESFVTRYPFQCFMFHDVWSKASERQAPDGRG